MDDSIRLGLLQESVNRLADGSVVDIITQNKYNVAQQLETYHQMLRDCVELRESDAALYIYHYLRQRVKPTLTTYQIIEPLHHTTKRNHIKIPLEFDQHRDTSIPQTSSDYSRTCQRYLPRVQSYLYQNFKTVKGKQPTVLIRALHDHCDISLETSEYLVHYLKKKGALTPLTPTQTLITSYITQ
jgi:hypothetical protein